jgi:hypothetical protein
VPATGKAYQRLAYALVKSMQQGSHKTHRSPMLSRDTVPYGWLPRTKTSHFHSGFQLFHIFLTTKIRNIHNVTPPHAPEYTERHII